MRKQVKLISVLAVFAIVVAACSGTSDETTTTSLAPEETSVIDLAIEAGGFSTLVAAVEAAGLVETLEGEGPFTLFAPTDAAFDAAFEALGITAEELLADTETLTSILTYHVLAQEADSQLVATLDGESVSTVNGEEITISIVDGAVMVDEATVVSADLRADNGIVHVIDSVLLPPSFELSPMDTTTTTQAPTEPTTTLAEEQTIVDLVIAATEADPAEFTVLLDAVIAADLVDLLSGDGPDGEGLTVFAPTDEAFEAAVDALGITLEELLGSEDLPSILAYHVLGNVVTSTDIAGAGLEEIPVETLLGEDLVVVVGDAGGVTFKDQTATVIQADIEASNGVIHIVDAVLIPPTG